MFLLGFCCNLNLRTFKKFFFLNFSVNGTNAPFISNSSAELHSSLPQFNPYIDPRSGQIFPQPNSISQLMCPPHFDGSGYPPELFSELSRAGVVTGFHIPGPHDNLPYPIFGIPSPMYGVRHLR